MKNLYSFVNKNKTQIIAVFKIWYYLIAVCTVVGGYLAYVRNPAFGQLYTLGVMAGRTAVIFYIITLLPGQSRAFGFYHPIVNTIQLLRRYFGISVFMLVFFHFTMVRGAGMVNGDVEIFRSWSTFELMGLGALSLLFAMFLTSNDFSVDTLGKWWKRLHRTTYVIAWLIFFHVWLQNPTSIWSILIGTAALVEVTAISIGLWKSQAKK